jgi:Protein of unknown function (DUF4011)/AAA domain
MSSQVRLGQKNMGISKPTTAKANGSVATSIDAKLDAARRRLLDMSRRNRLLNFRTSRRPETPSGAATDGATDEAPVRRQVDRRSLAIVEAAPTDVYRSLVEDEKTLEFSAASEAPENTQAALFDDEKTAIGDEMGTEPKPRPSSRRIGEAPRDKPHLQTPLNDDQLDMRLLFLAREAESALQEQGCNILYMCLGLLDWVDAESDGSTKSSAPIVLVPVELIRRDANQRYRVRLFDDAPVVNPALVELCRTNFRLEVPQLDSDSEMPVEELFRAIEQQIAKAKGWSLRREVHLGLFSFAKLLMYLDLDSSRWPDGMAISGHLLVQLMCGFGIELEHLGGGADLMPTNEIDDKLSPEETFQVMDADSSQQVAILGAKHGTSMVIEGPPGTGKSQTITNIIAECLAAGKTVLFVAEKAAALDVVKRRLDSVGLGEFALEMHSRKAVKRKILEDSIARCEPSTSPPMRQLLMRPNCSGFATG